MSGEKTEQPTPKKIRKAREDGNVPKSKDFQAGFLFLLGAAVVGATAGPGADRVRAFAIRCFSVGAEGPDRLLSLTMEVANDALVIILLVVMPLLGTIVITSLVVGSVQTGGLITFKSMQLKFDKLNPVSGLKNLFFTLKTYVELLKSLIKLTVAFYIGYRVVSANLRDVTLATALDVEPVMLLTKTLVGELIKKIGGFLLLVGFLDLVYQRWQWNKNQMMSKQEIKDEYKQTEGDPHTKGQRKRMAREIANQKGVKSVRQAKVVVTNPHEIAIALEYDEDGELAPMVLCKGERVVARQIIEEAELHGIPIMRNIALAHSLNELDVGDEIPEELYDAVAEVLNWVYAMEEGEDPEALDDGGYDLADLDETELAELDDGDDDDVAWDEIDW